METTKWVIEFLFTNFWHWLGGAIYIGIIFGSIGRIGSRIYNYFKQEKDEE